jgi:hypothetical protein
MTPATAERNVDVWICFRHDIEKFPASVGAGDWRNGELSAKGGSAKEHLELWSVGGMVGYRYEGGV